LAGPCHVRGVPGGWQRRPRRAAVYFSGMVVARSLHPRPSVHGEESHPKGSEPVYAEHSASKGVNLEKQSPILRCKRRAYSINGSG
jgi:hypothetical protein